MSNFFRKLPGGVIVPCGDADLKYVDDWKIGEIREGKFKRKRNEKFHRKVFALFEFAFEVWEPKIRTVIIQGEEIVPRKNFNQFRKDLTIAAGFFEANFDLRGNMRLEAKSISFAKMDDIEFEELFNKLIDVVIEKVLTNYTRNDVNRVVDELVGFI